MSKLVPETPLPPAGVYRDLQTYVPLLSEHLLNFNTHRKDKPLEFKNIPESTMFVMTFGGDGAPGPGNKTLTTFHVSFLNVGIRLLSSSETYVVFGADTEEDTLVVERFVKEATKAIE